MTTPELSDDELWELRDWSDQDKSFPSTTIIRLLDEHARLKAWRASAIDLLSRWRVAPRDVCQKQLAWETDQFVGSGCAAYDAAMDPEARP